MRHIERVSYMNFRLSVFTILFLASLFFYMGCQSNISGKPEPGKTEMPENRLSVREIKTGNSVKGADITAFETGDENGAVIMFLSGIRGDEEHVTPVAKRLVNFLKENPDMAKGRKIVVIPDINPDSKQKKTKLNANNVYIGHDFNSPSPQPETRAVIKAINKYKPARIISIRELKRPCIDYDGKKAKKVAKYIAKAGKFKVRKLGTSSGSLGDFAGNKLKIPVITISISGRNNKKADTDKLWEKCKDSFIAAIDYPGKPDQPYVTNPEPGEIPAKPLPGPESDDYETVFKKGNDFFAKGKYSDAQNVLQASGSDERCRQLILKCKNAENFLKQAQDNLASGYYDKALSNARELSSLNPADPHLKKLFFSSYYGMAITFFKNGEYKVARRKFSKALGYNRQCGECYKYVEKCKNIADIFIQGENYLASGLYNEALSCFQEIFAINSGDANANTMIFESYYGEAKAFFKKGKYKAAEKNFSKALNYNSKCHECRKYTKECQKARSAFSRGEKYFSKGKYKKALKEFGKVLKINNNDKEARKYINKANFFIYFNEGKELCKKQDTFKAAMNKFETALKYSANCDDCKDKAKNLIKKCKESKSHYYKGVGLFNDGKFEKAWAEFNKVIEGYENIDKYLKHLRKKISH